MCAPLDAARRSARRIFLQRASARFNAGRSITDIYLLLSGGFIVAALVPFSVIYVYGEEIFALVFGDDWKGAGAYARALIPWLITILPLALANAVFYVARRLNWWLMLQAVMALSGAATFVAGDALGWDSVYTVMVFSWVNFSFYGVGAAAAWWLTTQPPPEQLPFDEADATE